MLTCINCGHQCKATMYKVYGKEPSTKHVKLTDCNRCEKPIDDYIELDDCILFLDAILLKKRFYRHILNNESSTWQTTFKLSVLFLLSDAFFHWSKLRSRGGSYVEQELAFYIILSQVFLKNLFTYLCIVSVCYMKRDVDSQELFQGLILCSYVKLFQVPAVLWSSEFFNITSYIIKILLVLSMTQCLDVKTGKSTFTNFIITCLPLILLYLIELGTDSINGINYLTINYLNINYSRM